MKFEGFVGPAYNLQNTQYDCQTCINWYPEVNEVGFGKEASVAQFVRRPGLRRLVSGLIGPSRGGYVAGNQRLYWVFGSALYRITLNNATNPPTAGATKICNVAQDDSPVQMVDNGTHLFVLSALGCIAVNMTTLAVTTLTGGAVQPANSMTFIDNYVVFSQNNSNRFFWTDLLSTTANALNFATAEANTDQIVSIVNNNLDLWVFGRRTVELWYNYGQGSVTFARRPGVLIEQGCAATNTVQKIANTLMWMSASDRDGYQMMMAQGYNGQRVSTFPLEQQWARYANQIPNATGYTLTYNGHSFYVLNIPGAPETWVYDVTTSKMMGKPMWHTWRSKDTVNDQGLRHRAYGDVFYNGWHVTGDFEEGALYVLDQDYYYDNTKQIIRERTSPHISSEMRRVFYDELVLDFQTGIPSNNSLDPTVMLEFSDDGGETWSDQRLESAGTTGQYGLKVNFHRLGSGRNRVFRVRVSDPIPWALSSASLTLRQGSH